MSLEGIVAVLGVDFGTSFSAAALRSDGGALEPVRFGRDLRMSSAVMVAEDGSLSVGVGVERRAADAPERVERTPKRRLGDGLVVLGDQEFKDVELVAAVLAHVDRQAQHQNNGRGFDQVVLTHPVRWAQEGVRLKLLADAAAAVGWGEVAFVPEPVAAALALANRGRLAEVDVDGLVAVYDLGGGTFDTALLQRTAEAFELFGEPGGKEHLGGETLDDALLDRLSGHLSSDDEDRWRDPSDSDDPLAWARAGFLLREEVRRAKEDLIYEPELEIRLPSPFATERLRLSHYDLQRTARQLVDQTADELEATFRRNGKRVDQISAICLVGGSAQLAVVNRVLGQRFQRPVATWDDPKALTAEGATLFASIAGTATGAAASPAQTGGRRRTAAAGGSRAPKAKTGQPAETKAKPRQPTKSKTKPTARQPTKTKATPAARQPTKPKAKPAARRPAQANTTARRPAEPTPEAWLASREAQKRLRQLTELASVRPHAESPAGPRTADQSSAFVIGPFPARPDPTGFAAKLTKVTRTQREAMISRSDGPKVWTLAVHYNGLTELKISVDGRVVARFPMENAEFVRRLQLPLEDHGVTHTIVLRVGATLWGLAGITLASVEGRPILEDPAFEARVQGYRNLG